MLKNRRNSCSRQFKYGREEPSKDKKFLDFPLNFEFLSLNLKRVNVKFGDLSMLADNNEV